MSTQQSKLIGLLGGTFDPVHLEHVHIATRLLKRIPLKEIRFIPCKQPLLKDNPRASEQDRLAMLQLALKDQAGCIIDEVELQRDAPSYAITTLQTLRDTNPNAHLAFIIGSDNLRQLPRWHQWKNLTKLCHFIVVKRANQPSYDNAELSLWLQQHQINDAAELLEKTSGCVLEIDLDAAEISSTQIRQTIAAGDNPSQWLAPKVWEYIQKHQLYTEGARQKP